MMDENLTTQKQITPGTRNNSDVSPLPLHCPSEHHVNFLYVFFILQSLPSVPLLTLCPPSCIFIYVITLLHCTFKYHVSPLPLLLLQALYLPSCIYVSTLHCTVIYHKCPNDVSLLLPSLPVLSILSSMQLCHLFLLRHLLYSLSSPSEPGSADLAAPLHHLRPLRWPLQDLSGVQN